jgi:isoleucyl-tRNA synthetase
MNNLNSNETINFADLEKKIMDFWESEKIYSKIVEKRENGQDFDYTDGPPGVSGEVLHFGHMLISFIKSSMINYKQMNGFYCLNMIGFDCFGNPVYRIIDNFLGIKSKADIEKIGMQDYNNKCKEFVMSCIGSWKPIFDRIGRFLDYDNNYKTMDTPYMESEWYILKQLWEKDLIYHSFTIMSYCTDCKTMLSNTETSDNYKDITDPSVYFKLKLLNNDDENKYFIAWSTMPSTIPTNMALCLNPKLKYVTILDLKTKEKYILAENCLHSLYKSSNNKKDKKSILEAEYEILESKFGLEYDGAKYEPVFPYFEKFAKSKFFTVIMGDFVDDSCGTGIVHLSPGHGLDDFNACVNNNILKADEVGFYTPIDDDGYFTDLIHDYKGMYVFDSVKLIIARLKRENKLIKQENYLHSVAFCERTDTRIIFRAMSGYFVKVTAIKNQILENHDKVNFYPESLGSGRARNWLLNLKDWNISRNRSFHCVLPLWVSDDLSEQIMIGSIDELVNKANLKERPNDIHMEFIKDITIPSQQGNGTLKFCGFGVDCWFDSAIAAFGQLHYPFQNANAFDNTEYVSEFVCEGIDQLSKWFYYQQVISTALLNKPSFKNVMVGGLILAADGKKFSKRLNNFVNPINFCDKYSADALRLCLISSPASHGGDFKLNEEDVSNILKKYYQLINSLNFFTEHLTKFIKDGHNLKNDIKLNDELNTMDKWILSRLKTVINTVKDEMDNYRLFKLMPLIIDYIEDLTNWYIKFNRNRLKGRFCSSFEQETALSVLYNVLYTFTVAMAPFMPFLSETMYQILIKYNSNSNCEQSVHLCDYPSVLNSNILQLDIDQSIERKMKNLQTIAVMARHLRFKSANSTSAKVPLRNMIIGSRSNEFISDVKELEKYLLEEINVMNVSYSDANNMLKYVVKPDNKAIGSKFKNNANKVKELIKEHELLIVEQFKYNRASEITLPNSEYKLSSTDIEYDTVFASKLNDGELVTFDNGIVVIIDTTHDDNVINLYLSRLFVGTIQKLRKEAKLKPWNKINIYYETESNRLIDAINKYKSKIVEELIYDIKNKSCPTNEEIIISKDNIDLYGNVVKITISSS